MTYKQIKKCIKKYRDLNLPNYKILDSEDRNKWKELKKLMVYIYIENKYIENDKSWDKMIKSFQELNKTYD